MTPFNANHNTLCTTVNHKKKHWNQRQYAMYCSWHENETVYMKKYEEVPAEYILPAQQRLAEYALLFLSVPAASVSLFNNKNSHDKEVKLTPQTWQVKIYD
jgi:hypothetical protein